MKKLTTTLLIYLSLAFTHYASANPLGTCMVDSLNGKERKALATWIFLSMSQHPAISKFSQVSEQDIVDVNKEIGNTISRLMVEDCPEEASTTKLLTRP